MGFTFRLAHQEPRHQSSRLLRITDRKSEASLTQPVVTSDVPIRLVTSGSDLECRGPQANEPARLGQRCDGAIRGVPGPAVNLATASVVWKPWASRPHRPGKPVLDPESGASFDPLRP